jgi:hypothetical protein
MSSAVVFAIVVAPDNVVGTRLGNEFMMGFVELPLDFFVVDVTIPIVVELVEKLVNLLVVEVLDVG